MERPPRNRPERVLSAIVLAAGLSRRMGPANKLLLDVGGVPLVRRSVEIVLAHPFAEVVVVTGHESSRVEEAAARRCPSASPSTPATKKAR